MHASVRRRLRAWEQFGGTSQLPMYRFNTTPAQPATVTGPSDGDSIISALAGGGMRPQARDSTSHASLTAANSIKGALGMNVSGGEHFIAALGAPFSLGMHVGCSLRVNAFDCTLSWSAKPPNGTPDEGKVCFGIAASSSGATYSTLQSLCSELYIWFRRTQELSRALILRICTP